MIISQIDIVNEISASDFKRNYYQSNKPLVIKNLSAEWPGYSKWTWDFLKQSLGDKRVGIYNNIKSDAMTPVNTADAYVTFADYIEMISKGKCEWRIFLFNLFSHAPELMNDFEWPDHLMNGFVKKFPMLFTGGEKSVTHMHFDMDLSHILHTQFLGKKRVLLFPYEEKDKLYRKPFEVLSMADFSGYYDPDLSKVDYDNFPALRLAKGYETILEHGDTLFMPAGYWHHMEYIESGLALSLRAMRSDWPGKINGLWNLFGMRSIDTFMKKNMPGMWYDWKRKKVYRNARHAQFSGR